MIPINLSCPAGAINLLTLVIVSKIFDLSEVILLFKTALIPE